MNWCATCGAQHPGPTHNCGYATISKDRLRELEDIERVERVVSVPGSERESSDFRCGYQRGWVDAMKEIERRDEFVTGLLRYRLLPSTEAECDRWMSEARRQLELPAPVHREEEKP